MNNLKVMGLALLNYESANGTFPMSSALGEGHGNGHSAFMAILPFLEEVRTYNNNNFSLENWHPANQTAVGARVAVYLCPDNPDVKSVSAQEVRFPESRSNFAKAHYGVNWGGGRGPWGEDFVATNGIYAGVMMAVTATRRRGQASGRAPPAQRAGERDHRRHGVYTGHRREA